jgi:hypothetical protein
MQYLGVAKYKNGRMIMPDNFTSDHEEDTYEAIEIDDTIVLLRSQLSQKRLARIEKLTKQSIDEHRTTLEGLAH